MLSAGRGLLLGQTQGGAHIVPWTSTFFSGKEGWFLIISLFFISLPQGTAWPHGKRLTKQDFPLNALLFASLLVTVSWFMFFVLQGPVSALSPSPLPCSPLRTQQCSAKLVKEDPQRDSDVQTSLLQRRGGKAQNSVCAVFVVVQTLVLKYRGRDCLVWSCLFSY